MFASPAVFLQSFHAGAGGNADLGLDAQQACSSVIVMGIDAVVAFFLVDTVAPDDAGGVVR